jgi:hypothetical protein
MARAHLPRSTAEVSFWSPLVVLPLAVGGGSVIGRATLERLRLIHLDQRCSGEFRTPLAILPLMGGGGVRNSVACEMGPPPVLLTTVSHFPSTTCTPLNRVTGVLLFSSPVGICSYWPFSNPVGIHPYWPVASPVGVRRLQSRTIQHHCSSEVRNTKRHCVYLNCDHDPRSHGNEEREKRASLC